MPDHITTEELSSFTRTSEEFDKAAAKVLEDIYPLPADMQHEAVKLALRKEYILGQVHTTNTFKQSTSEE